LTCNKKDANPSLTWVLFDLTQKDFFEPKGNFFEKFDIFKGNFQTQNQTKNG